MHCSSLLNQSKSYVCIFCRRSYLLIIIIFKIYIAPLTYKMDKRHRTRIKKHRMEEKTKKKDWSPGQCPNKSMGIRLSRQQRTNSYLLHRPIPAGIGNVLTFSGDRRL